MTDLLNKVTQGDCLEVMKDIPDGSVDMILCDLPYGTTACKWDSIIPFEPLWEQYERVIKDNGAIVLTASQPFTTALISSNIELFKYEWIWEKSTSAGFVHAKNMPLKRHENICVFSKAPMGHASLLGERRMQYNPQGLREVNKVHRRPTTGMVNVIGKRPSHVNEFEVKFENYPTSILKFPSGNNKNVHPTQKPVALFEYLIKTYTNEGEIVLDNCIGSGTTAIAALNTGRYFIGIEKEREYVDIANRRIIDRIYEMSQSQGVGYRESSCDCRTINRCVDGKCKHV